MNLRETAMNLMLNHFKFLFCPEKLELSRLIQLLRYSSNDLLILTTLSCKIFFLGDIFLCLKEKT